MTIAEAIGTVTQQVEETEDEFIFTTINPYCETVIKREISKKELARALEKEFIVGKWIEDWEVGYSECSNCCESYLWEDYKGVGEFNYCPNCGKRMKGDKV